MKFMSVIATLGIGAIEGYGLYVIVTDGTIATTQAGLTVVSLIFLVATALTALGATFKMDLIKTHIPIISGWKGLGLLQIFLAALTLSTLGVVLKYDQGSTLTTLAQIAAFALAVVGALHFLFGLCGGERVKEKQELELSTA